MSEHDVKPKLSEILQGIMLTSDSNTDGESLKSISEIKAYAKAMGATITDFQAKKIQQVGIQFIREFNNLHSANEVGQMPLIRDTLFSKLDSKETDYLFEVD